jgi:hypothetical protein
MCFYTEVNVLNLNLQQKLGHLTKKFEKIEFFFLFCRDFFRQIAIPFQGGFLRSTTLALKRP